MPTVLSDPPLTLYVVLIVAAAVTGTIWFRNRTRRSLLWFAAADQRRPTQPTKSRWLRGRSSGNKQ